MTDFLKDRRVTLLGADSLAFSLDLGTDTFGTDGPNEYGRGQILGHDLNVSYWASTAHPYSGVTGFAIGASNGALIVTESQGRWTADIGERSSEVSEVMAVDWLSSNVVMKGCKDGGVRLWDIRSHGESRESRIQHPSQINHARRIDENTIVVAGLESQVRTSTVIEVQNC